MNRGFIAVFKQNRLYRLLLQTQETERDKNDT